MCPTEVSHDSLDACPSTLVSTKGKAIEGESRYTKWIANKNTDRCGNNRLELTGKRSSMQALQIEMIEKHM